jgi:hypothetical protein
MQETAPYPIDVNYHVYPPGYVQALRRIGLVEAGGVQGTVVDCHLGYRNE